MKIYIPLAVTLIFFDTITKYWAENILKDTIVLIPEFLSLQFVKNIGIAFSLPVTGNVLKVITVILILGIFYYYWKEEKAKKSRLVDISYVFILAGALGNAWERLFRGYVTDMISVEHFAIFNLADSYITLGAIGLIYFYFTNKS